MRLATKNPIMDSPLQRLAEWWVARTCCLATHLPSGHVPIVALDRETVVGCSGCEWMPDFGRTDWRTSGQQYEAQHHMCVCVIRKRRHGLLFHTCRECGFAWPRSSRS